MVYLRVTLQKNRFINSLVQHSKNHEHATCIDFQFHNLKGTLQHSKNHELVTCIDFQFHNLKGTLMQI